jgi:hypothetical protein
MHVLNERYRNIRMMAHSSPWGFSIIGNAPTEGVAAAAHEGLRRLQAGSRHLAIHPNCGSTLVVAGSLAGLASFLALGGLSRNRPRGWFERLSRLLFACAAATVAIVLAQPLGGIFQSHVTTQADVGDLRVTGVTRETRAGVVIHHVRTEG